MEMVALHIKSAFIKSLFCTVFILLAIKVSLYLLKTACQKDLEKSLKSKCLTRTLKKKSYYMNFNLINKLLRQITLIFVFKVHEV